MTTFVDVDPNKRGKTVHGVPVIGPHDLQQKQPPGFYLAAVGKPGARDQIRALLKKIDLSEPDHFISVA